jgi:hypothetical protein
MAGTSKLFSFIMLITSSTFKSLGFLTANSAPSKPKSATFLILFSKSSLKAKAENLVG